MKQELVTLPRYLVEQAMKALEDRESTPAEYDTYHALRSALEQPPTIEQPQVEQEPVAWIENLGGGISYSAHHEAARKLPEGVRFNLYTHPQPQPQPKREPLTDEQIVAMWEFPRDLSWMDSVVRLAHAIERTHGIK